MDVYVINLDRQAERRSWMERVLGDAKVPFLRVSAVDGRRLSQAALDKRTEGNAKRLTRFDVALIMSHRKVWRRLLRSPALHCAVLEDDIHIGHGFAELLAALDTARIAFDIIKLECVGERVLVDAGAGSSVGGRKLYPLRSAYMGTAGYVVSRRGAGVLLDITRSLAVPIDWFLFAEPYLASNGLAVLQTVPGIVAQEEHLQRLSTTRELRSNRPVRAVRVAPFRKVWREALRPFGQLRDALKRQRLRRAAPGLRWGRIDFE